MNNSAVNKERRDAILRILLSAMIIVFFVCVVFVYYRMLVSKTRESFVNSGRVNAIEQADQIDNYMSASLDILKLSGYTVDNMIRTNRSQEEILDYLVNETKAVGDSLIANTTGIYGYIRGEYMDGSGWVPDEDYDPTVRPWYVEAIAGEGRIIIVDPYVDLDTGTVMIALAYTLSDNKSVVGIDISMEELQNLTEEHVKEDRSYAEFIFNSNGMIVAHSDRRLIGTALGDGSDYMTDVIGRRLSVLNDNYFELEHNGKNYMVYVMPLENDWTCVSIIDASDEYSKLRIPLTVTALITILVVSTFVILTIIFNRNSREVSRSFDASRRAMAANEANMTFLGDVSQTIKSSINSMLDMNEKIRNGGGGDTVLSYSDSIKNDGNDLLDLIDDITDYSEIKSGKIELNPVEYDISDMIGNIIDKVRPAANMKDVIFSVRTSKEIPRLLYGDRDRLEQIITMILKNIVRSSEKGNVELFVSSTSVASSKDQIILECSVSGRSLSGIGLENAAGLLELMGTTIQYDEGNGQEATVSFGLSQKIISRETLGGYDKVFRPIREKVASDNETKDDDTDVLLKDIREAAERMDCTGLEKAVSKLEDRKFALANKDLFIRIKEASEKYDYDEVVRLISGN